MSDPEERVGAKPAARRRARPFAEAFPALAAQWHPEKNGSLTPSDVSAFSGERVWWLGPCGHEWLTAPRARAEGHGCPYCAGRKVLAGFNDLATKAPALAAEWHPEKNGALAPSDVAAGSRRKAWWLGPCGHEWEAAVSNRYRGSGCPYCSGRRLLPGLNDLATRRPEVAAQWHPTLNGPLTPSDVMPGSGVGVWWKCPACGCEWKAPPAVRTRPKGTGCPSCAVARRSRPIRCVETGERFDSVSAAVEARDVARPAVYKAVAEGCLAGGFHWEWAVVDG